MSIDNTNDESFSAQALIARAEDEGCLLTAEDLIAIKNGCPPDTAAITPSTYMLVYGEPGFTAEATESVENQVAQMGVTACVSDFNAAAPVGYVSPEPQTPQYNNLPSLTFEPNKSAGDC